LLRELRWPFSHLTQIVFRSYRQALGKINRLLPACAALVAAFLRDQPPPQGGGGGHPALELRTVGVGPSWSCDSAPARVLNSSLRQLLKSSREDLPKDLRGRAMTTLTELRVASNDLTQIPSDSLGRLDTLQVWVAPKLWTCSAVRHTTKTIHCNTRVCMSTD